MNEGNEVNSDDPTVMWAEIARLRATVAKLERQVGELDRLAHHDPLVPLPNRRGFERQLAHLIDRTERYGDVGALLFVDVDGMKFVNDSFGHDAGDAALIHIAELLTGGVRQSDTVARFGGDEFAVLLERVDLDQATETATRLTDRIAGSNFSFGGVCIPLSAAIGIAEIRGDDTPESVLVRADRAMYEQKAAA
ncbi:GGDEF domain-containing protein [Sphingomonas glaciei]|uniref:GGDEF domain-containing protein n=1 Tax=Sphingomonas glaciei TaxID=2938948 RepID=A0ABY5MRL6_9SPHN|nr:GGDEF domain-containing protein [Sphingomonas glaciei]UUR07134.1 GGDEF domain-containing protein [Sphingomonas glaciei]